MKEGDIRITKEICRSQECEVCGEEAIYKATFLLPNARSNPASNAYGRDDCSWCSDDKAFLCEEHKNDKYKIAKDKGMGWCSMFPKERFEHMFLFWEKDKETK